MPTPYSVLIDRFFHRVEEDRSFFEYYSLSDDEAMPLAQTRATNYLADAADRVTLECQSTFDFSDRDDVLAQFNGELNSKEVFLLSSLMYEYYLAGYISKLKTYEVNYTSTDLRVFSPDKARDSFKALYDGVCTQNAALLDLYRSTDRETHLYKGIDYSQYRDEEG